MPPIEDYGCYIAGMEKSMEDKLFWLDKIPKEEYSTVIDYGCADGTFLKKVREFNPDCFVCGVDIDDWMLQEAKSKFDKNSMFVNEAYLCEPSHLRGEVLNLSSVIHEVYSYKKNSEIKKFWDYVKGHKYVCIRDMCISKDIYKLEKMPELKYLGDGEKVRRFNFESIWGSLDDPKNYIHYLLKYRYIENWNREVKENYLPLYLNGFIHIAKLMGYTIKYCEHYTLPFLKDKVYEDFGVELNIPTHVKMIWERKE